MPLLERVRQVSKSLRDEDRDIASCLRESAELIGLLQQAQLSAVVLLYVNSPRIENDIRGIVQSSIEVSDTLGKLQGMLQDMSSDSALLRGESPRLASAVESLQRVSLQLSRDSAKLRERVHQMIHNDQPGDREDSSGNLLGHPHQKLTRWLRIFSNTSRLCSLKGQKEHLRLNLPCTCKPLGRFHHLRHSRNTTS